MLDVDPTTQQLAQLGKLASPPDLTPDLRTDEVLLCVSWASYGRVVIGD